MLRAVPVKRLDVNVGDAFDAGAILRVFDFSQLFRRYLADIFNT